ncbi:MAG: hypothetical protein LC794_13450 [Acidobacteria bacterium]|nr:hypothetical protein [Acidobacteriota bacterium]MCA1627677.1 hypothetical protein [Acidobacteriota bacterium]
MFKSGFTLKMFALVACTLAFTVAAQAQATRTWVSGVGDDVNPCSRTAPCKTFAGAISKTATGGEISVLDPGGYGTLTITKAITVDGGTGSGWGSTLFSAVNGFVINITTNLATDKVILRNLSINGAGTTLGVDGVRFLDGAELTLENVSIFNFSGDGVEVNQTQACRVNMRDVTFSHGGIGIKSSGTAASVSMNLENVRINSMSSHGIQAINNTIIFARSVHVFNSGVGGTGDGFRAEGLSGSSTINCTGCSSNANAANGFNAFNVGLIRISDCEVYHNASTGISNNVRSGGGNRFAFNGVNGTPAATDIVVQ